MNWLKRLLGIEEKKEIKEEKPLPPPDSIVTDILKWVESIDPTVDDDYICKKEEKKGWNSTWERYERTVSYEFYDKTGKGFCVENDYVGVGQWNKPKSYFRLVTIFKFGDEDFTKRGFVSLDKMLELNHNEGNEPFIRKIFFRLRELYPQSRSYKLEREEEAKRKGLEKKVDGEIFDLFSNNGIK